MRRYNPHRIRSRDVSRSFRNFESKTSNQYDAGLEDPMHVDSIESELQKLYKESLRMKQKLKELEGL